MTRSTSRKSGGSSPNEDSTDRSLEESTPAIAVTVPSSSNNIIGVPTGRVSQLEGTNRNPMWNPREIEDLLKLTAPYGERNVNWKEVYEKWTELGHRPRTKIGIQGAYRKFRTRGPTTENVEAQESNNERTTRIAETQEEITATMLMEVDPTTTNVTEPTEDAPTRDEINEFIAEDKWRSLQICFKKALGEKERCPLPKTANLKGEEKDLIDLYVRKLTKGNVETWNLNAGLYAAVKSVCHKDTKDKYRLRVDEVTLIRKVILTELNILRQEINRLTHLEHRGGRWRAKVERLKTKYGFSTLGEMIDVSASLKMKLKSYQEELEQHRSARKRMDIRKKGARLLLRESNRNEGPDEDSITNFWEQIVGKELNNSIERVEANPEGKPLSLTEIRENAKKAIREIRPWKAPGPDGIQAYWWKNIPFARNTIIENSIRMVTNREEIPEWMGTGKVFLLPKTAESGEDPSQYRPIACLNTCYKIVTSTIKKIMDGRINLPEEQMSLKKGIRGCAHAHILDQVITNDAKFNKKPLSMTWIDMKKAYDSISHEAIRTAIQDEGLPESIYRVVDRILRIGNLKYVIPTIEGKPKLTRTVKVKRGILQGDSLSPLLFCLGIKTLSRMINELGKGYRTNMIGSNLQENRVEISHTLYMDDLKIYTTSMEDEVMIVEAVQERAREIGLELNEKKSATCRMNLPHEQLSSIPVLAIGEEYKYLGIEQSEQNAGKSTWERLEIEAKDLREKIFSSNLTIRQMVEAYNQRIIGKVRYLSSCGITFQGRLECQLRKAKDLDKELGRDLWKFKIREYKSCTARQFVPTKSGGLGFYKAEDAMKDAILSTWDYVIQEKSLRLAKAQAEVLRRRGKRSLSLDVQHITGLSEVTDLKKERDDAKKKSAELSLQEWKKRTTSARMLGQDISEDSFLWIRRGHLGKECFRIITGCQEGHLFTNDKVKTSRKNSNLCRKGCSYKESEEHILTGCAFWRNSLMISRHNSIVEFIAQQLLQKLNLTYEKSKKIYEDNDQVVYIDMPIRTVANIMYNKPDIVWMNKKEMRTLIIEISVTWFTRLEIQEERKILKYTVNGNHPEGEMQTCVQGENLAKALKNEQKQQVEFLPIIISATGECNKKLRANLNKIGIGRAEFLIERIQRLAIAGSNQIMKRHLSN